MQVILNIFISLLLFIITSLSISIIYRTTHFFHIAHAIMITFGAYLIYLFANVTNLYISVIYTIILTIILSLVIYLFIYNSLLKKQVPPWQMLIASLGVYIVSQNLISMCFGDDTKSFRIWEIKEGHQFLGAYITDVQIITIVVSIILLFLSWLFIEKTKAGKQIKAVSSNPEMASILGISKEKAILVSFALGSGLAAVAGILIAADTDMTPTMGFNWLLYAVIAMIIGGMGKMRYLFMGALLLATAQHLSAYYLDSKWMNATAFIILIIFLYFKPYGFSGQKLKKAEI